MKKLTFKVTVSMSDEDWEYYCEAGGSKRHIAQILRTEAFSMAGATFPGDEETYPDPLWILGPAAKLSVVPMKDGIQPYR